MPSRARCSLMHAAIFVDHLHRHHTLRSCQRDAEAGVHVFGDARGGATQRHQSLAGHGLMFRNGERRSAGVDSPFCSAIACCCGACEPFARRGSRRVSEALPPLVSKTSFQLSSTFLRSLKYCWYSSSSSQLLIPSSGARGSDMEIYDEGFLLHHSVPGARELGHANSRQVSRVVRP